MQDDHDPNKWLQQAIDQRRDGHEYVSNTALAIALHLGKITESLSELIEIVSRLAEVTERRRLVEDHERLIGVRPTAARPKDVVKP